MVAATNANAMVIIPANTRSSGLGHNDTRGRFREQRTWLANGDEQLWGR